MHNVYFPSVAERQTGLYLIVQPLKPPKPSQESPSGGPAGMPKPDEKGTEKEEPG